jgi:hypothetical protein
MKINEHYLSIPPHISVSWKEVASLSTQADTLIIQLKGGKTFSIQGLSVEQLETIFTYHLLHIEQENLPLPPMAMPPMPMGKIPVMNPFQFDPMELLELPIAFKIGTPDGVVSALTHNPTQSDAKLLPTELLDKIASITKNMGGGVQDVLPPGIDGCRCYFCQIMNHIHLQRFLEQEVSDEELHFHDWTVQETGENLFSVENPLDSAEKYSVYLGHPVGCSCGKSGCEHLIAVLKS